MEGDNCHMKKLKRLLNDNIHRLGENDGLENVLLEYILGFTEYRNHSAAACHVDTHIEILSVIVWDTTQRMHIFIFHLTMLFLSSM